MSAPLVRTGIATGYPLVQGRCPCCGSRGLFVGEGGYITCSWLECSEPDAATKALES